MSILGNIISKESSLLTRPRITEKATGQAALPAPIYTFEVSPRSTKTEIAKEVKRVYGVTPEKVNIIHLPAKRVIVRGRRGVTAATKKAMVYLKAGDKIEII